MGLPWHHAPYNIDASLQGMLGCMHERVNRALYVGMPCVMVLDAGSLLIIIFSTPIPLPLFFFLLYYSLSLSLSLSPSPSPSLPLPLPLYGGRGTRGTSASASAAAAAAATAAAAGVPYAQRSACSSSVSTPSSSVRQSVDGNSSNTTTCLPSAVSSAPSSSLPSRAPAPTAHVRDGEMVRSSSFNCNSYPALLSFLPSIPSDACCTH